MCGIVASFGGKPIESALEAYKGQKGRGQEGFGFLALRGGHLVAHARRTHENGIRESLEASAKLRPDAILFHHRYPTSTANVPEAAHPLPIKRKGWKSHYYMIHNGVVLGGDMGEISKAGYKFKSRVEEIKYYRAGGKLYERIESSDINDSEILGYYVASLLEGEREDIPMTGAIACIVLQENKKTGKCTVYAMRNEQNPLKVYRDGQTLLIASEGNGVDLPSHQIHVLDLPTLRFSTHKVVNIGKVYIPTYSGYGFKPYQDVPQRALPISQYIGGEAVLERELDKLRRKADAAYSEYEEACEAFGDDDTPEANEYIADYLRRYEEAEEALEEAGGVVETDLRDAVMKF